ncbi:MAG: MFS transporter [Dehalococcoidia bacterium]
MQPEAHSAPAAPERVGRNFWLLWLSTVAMGAGQQMEMLALGWYVLQQTNSPVLVGLIGAARWGGMLFAPFGGVLADRVPRRTLLLAVQALAFAAALLITTVAFARTVETALLFVVVVAAGLARSFDQIARQSLVADLAPRDRLTSAVALIQAAMNGSAVVAPLVAGVLFGVGGLALCYLAVTVLNLSAVAAIVPVGRRSRFPVADSTSAAVRSSRRGSGRVRGDVEGGGVADRVGALRSLAEGGRYVARTPVVAALLLLAAVANMCTFPLTFTMMPSFARDVLGVGSVGLGGLLSAFGVGALLGNVALSSRGSLHRRGRLAVVGMLSWSAAIVLFASSRWFPLSLALLVGVGVCSALSMSLIGALLLTITPESLRGRVMGVRMFAIATLPLGASVSGWLIAAVGAPWTAALYAATGATLTLLTVWRLPPLLRQA